MDLPIRLISTDFDGTLFAEFEDPPVPVALQRALGELQAGGAKWVINTGRDMASLMETLGRAHLSVRPDYLVLVEREIYRHDRSQYLGDEAWNQRCQAAHAMLFRRVRERLGEILDWINDHFSATVYEDVYSPFCLIAESNDDADKILRHLEPFCRSIPHLTVMRNDVYARFSHADFTKGTALGEIARQLGIGPEHILAAGDHFNDLPMMDPQFARMLVAPVNAIEEVKRTVREQNGWVSEFSDGHGVLEGLENLGKTPESSLVGEK